MRGTSGMGPATTRNEARHSRVSGIVADGRNMTGAGCGNGAAGEWDNGGSNKDGDGNQPA